MSNIGKKFGSPKPLDALLVDCFNHAPEWRREFPPHQQPVIVVALGDDLSRIDLRDHPKYFENPPGTRAFLLTAEGRRRAQRVISAESDPKQEASEVPE